MSFQSRADSGIKNLIKQIEKELDRLGVSKPNKDIGEADVISVQATDDFDGEYQKGFVKIYDDNEFAFVGPEALLVKLKSIKTKEDAWQNVWNAVSKIEINKNKIVAIVEKLITAGHADLAVEILAMGDPSSFAKMKEDTHQFETEYTRFLEKNNFKLDKEVWKSDTGNQIKLEYITIFLDRGDDNEEECQIIHSIKITTVKGKTSHTSTIGGFKPAYLGNITEKDANDYSQFLSKIKNSYQAIISKSLKVAPMANEATALTKDQESLLKSIILVAENNFPQFYKTKDAKTAVDRAIQEIRASDWEALKELLKHSKKAMIADLPELKENKEGKYFKKDAHRIAWTDDGHDYFKPFSFSDLDLLEKIIFEALALDLEPKVAVEAAIKTVLNAGLKELKQNINAVKKEAIQQVTEDWKEETESSSEKTVSSNKFKYNPKYVKELRIEVQVNREDFSNISLESDLEKSHKKYMKVFEKELEKEFPEAKIGVHSGAASTKVYIEIIDDEDIKTEIEEDFGITPEELENYYEEDVKEEVDDIISNRVFERQEDWVVEKEETSTEEEASVRAVAKKLIKAGNEDLAKEILTIADGKKQEAENAIRDMFLSKHYNGKVPLKDIDVILKSKRWDSLYGKKNVTDSWKDLVEEKYVTNDGNFWVWENL